MHAVHPEKLRQPGAEAGVEGWGGQAGERLVRAETE